MGPPITTSPARSDTRGRSLAETSRLSTRFRMSMSRPLPSNASRISPGFSTSMCWRTRTVRAGMVAISSEERGIRDRPILNVAGHPDRNRRSQCTSHAMPRFSTAPVRDSGRRHEGQSNWRPPGVKPCRRAGPPLLRRARRGPGMGARPARRTPGGVRRVRADRTLRVTGAVTTNVRRVR